ncbi:hypothetical protein HYC85_003938 [Camellia sinensis]|uniref:F-box associated beta-propeller type 1 domain-containing protein n=1 Tax=Camellia sinensis TaxID=4442 RepID=A0A7J7HV23_CAMSI|nr:hypothetical protein HYC85_003938 [Camellia sinensis]
MTEKVSTKRRKLVIGSTSLEDSLAVEVVVSNVDLLTEILLHVPAVDTPFLTVLKTWTSPFEHSVIIHDRVRSEFPEVSARAPCLRISELNRLVSGFALNTCVLPWKGRECLMRHPHTPPAVAGGHRMVATLYLAKQSMFGTTFSKSVSQNDLPDLDSLVQIKNRDNKNRESELYSSLPTLAFLNGVGEGSTPRIVCSCNGLLLCSKVYGKRYIVCNPTTQKYTALPEPAGTLSRFLDHKLGAYLAFDPSKSPHYKVVLVNYSFDLCGRSGSSYVIDIYSSESASWKHIHVIAPPGHSLRRRVFSNRAIHWMTSSNLYIRFDVAAENLTRTLMPPYPKILSDDKILYFGECHGYLFLIQNRQVLPLRFRILEMDRDYCCWKVKYWVNLRPIESLFPEKFHQFSMVCIVKGANEKDFALVFNIYGNFISYNLDRKTWKVLLDFQPCEFHESVCYYNSYNFIESLSPV